jgi:hypothetical protein
MTGYTLLGPPTTVTLRLVFAANGTRRIFENVTMCSWCDPIASMVLVITNGRRECRSIVTFTVTCDVGDVSLLRTRILKPRSLVATTTFKRDGVRYTSPCCAVMGSALIDTTLTPAEPAECPADVGASRPRATNAGATKAKKDNERLTLMKRA